MEDNKINHLNQAYNTPSPTFAPMGVALFKDPKNFQEAPYSFHMAQNELVVLNNGTLQYSVTDFILPGRNGFDLIMTRRYNSYSAGLFDMNPQYVAPGRLHTGRRDNTHNNKQYGLGFGWYFVLPSIEVVPESEQDKERFTYPVYLHLEDGRNFEVEDNKLKGHPLQDVTISQETGSIIHPHRSDVSNSYHVVVTYKNGNKDYFRKILDGQGRLDSYTLVVRQDRFSNTICFSLLGRNGMTVVDTWGRNIELSASGNTMSWTMPDHTAASPRRITYTINDADGRRLVQVADQLNRVTRYEYHSANIYRAVSRFASEDYGDTSNTEFPFLLLRRITHPTGAFAEYEYGVIRNGTVSPMRLEINERGGFRQYFPIRSRRDVSGGTEYNPVGYTYVLSANNQYIGRANVQKLFNVTEQHAFSDHGQLVHKEMRHANSLVLSNSYVYGTNPHEANYKLITSEDARRYNTQPSSQHLRKLTQWQYTADKKANISRITETYPSDTALNQETNMFYGAYSILTEKNYKKDENTTIYLKYTLRLNPDNKVAEFKRVYENTTLTEKTQYIYGATDNNRYCVTQERRFLPVSNEGLENATAFLQVHFTYDSRKFTHAPITTEVAGIVDADGNSLENIVERFNYDVCGRLISQTDANNNTTNIVYDAVGRVVSEALPAVNGQRDFRLTHYNDVNNFITATDENQFKRRYEYTPLGQIDRVFLARGNAPETVDILLFQHEYDALGRKTSEKAYDGNGIASGNVKTTAMYVYDRFDRITSKTVTEVDYAETHVYTDVYADPDDPGRLYFFHQKTIAGNGAAAPSLVTTSYTDQQGQVRKTFSGGARVATYIYNKVGDIVGQLDAMSRQTVWTHDYAGRSTSSTQWLNGRAQTARAEYDNLGNKKYSWDYMGRQTELFYDAAGRLIRQVSPFDTRKSTIKNYYDPAGNLLWRKVNEGTYWHEREYRYDSRNRQTEVLQYTFKNLHNLNGARWLRTVFGYDSVGNTTEIRTGYTESSNSHNAIRYTYNRFGTVLTITDAQGQIERFQYDNIGTIRNYTDRNGRMTHFEHDALGRLTRESVTANILGRQITSAREVVYARTGAKHIETSRETGGNKLAIEYAYNNRGELVRQVDPDGVIKEYTYNTNGTLETFRLFLSGIASPEIFLHYAYDDLNRLNLVRNGGATGTIIAEYRYDANGNCISVQHPQRNIEAVYTYNEANLVLSLENRRSGIRTSAWTYSYLLDGNPSSLIDNITSRATTYQYDRLGRLVRERDPAWNTIAYEYDQHSNRTRMVVSGLESYATSYEYHPNNLLARERKRQGSVTETFSYRYDANGNQIYREWEKTSTASDKPGKMDFPNEERTNAPAILDMREYNGFDQLIRVRRPPADVRYQYRPDGLRHSKVVANPFSGAKQITIHHWDGAGIVMETVNGKVAARYLYGLNLIAQQISGSLSYYLFNMRGDIVQHVAGSNASIYEYNAFGNEKNPSPADLNPFRYGGEYWDSETETYYIRARYYNPASGRWLAEDSTRYGQNWYVYCDNNPIAFSDPSGNILIPALAGTTKLLGMVTTFVKTTKAVFASKMPTIPNIAASAVGAGAGAIGGFLGAHSNERNVTAAVFGGMIAGAVPGLFTSIPWAAGVGGFASVLNESAQGFINNDSSVGNVAASAISGAVFGGIGGAMSKGIGKTLGPQTGWIGAATYFSAEFLAQAPIGAISIPIGFGINSIAGNITPPSMPNANMQTSVFEIITSQSRPGVMSPNIPSITPPSIPNITLPSLPSVNTPVFTPPSIPSFAPPSIPSLRLPTWVPGRWELTSGQFITTPGRLVVTPGQMLITPGRFVGGQWIPGTTQWIPGTTQWIPGTMQWQPGTIRYIPGFWQW